MADPMGVNTGFRINQAQQKAQAQRDRITSGPLVRPDSPTAGFRTNDRPPAWTGTSAPMQARHEGDTVFGNSAFGNGAMGVEQSHVMTGGGAAGSMMAQQAGQKRGQGLMGSIPQLTAMQPYKAGSNPNTAGMFKQLDNQVAGIAQRGGGAGQDSLLAGFAQGKPQGIATTAQAPKVPGSVTPPAVPKVGMPELPKDVFASAGPIGPSQDEMGSRSSRPLPYRGSAPKPVASIGGQMDPRLVGSRQQVQRAQGRINAGNVAAQGGIVGPPRPNELNAMTPARPDPMVQALNGGQVQPSFLDLYNKTSNAARVLANSGYGEGHPDVQRLDDKAGQYLQLHMHQMSTEGNNRVAAAQAEHWKAQADAAKADASFKPREFELREKELAQRSALAAAEAEKTRGEAEFNRQRADQNRAFVDMSPVAQVTLRNEGLPHDERQRVYDSEMLDRAVPGSSRLLPNKADRDPIDPLQAIVNFKKQFPTAGPEQEDAFVAALRGNVPPEEFEKAQNPPGDQGWFRKREGISSYDPINWLVGNRQFNWDKLWFTPEQQQAARLARTRGFNPGGPPAIKRVIRPSVSPVSRTGS